MDDDDERGEREPRNKINTCIWKGKYKKEKNNTNLYSISAPHGSLRPHVVISPLYICICASVHTSILNQRKSEAITVQNGKSSSHLVHNFPSNIYCEMWSCLIPFRVIK